MLISGTGQIRPNKSELNRPVELLLGTTAPGTYFQDRNPDRTHVSEFNRELELKQRNEQLQKKKHRDMLNSEDYRTICNQMSMKGGKARLDAFR
jgi:hypothetical protein